MWRDQVIMPLTCKTIVTHLKIYIHTYILSIRKGLNYCATEPGTLPFATAILMDKLVCIGDICGSNRGSNFINIYKDFQMKATLG